MAAVVGSLSWRLRLSAKEQRVRRACAGNGASVGPRAAKLSFGTVDRI